MKTGRSYELRQEWGQLIDTIIEYLLIPIFLLMILTDSDEGTTTIAGIIFIVALFVMAAGIGKIKNAIIDYLIQER